jgi:4-aminobutyrate aminotransferase-like enzyme
MVVREPYAEAVDKISASTSYGGNPMACAAALASIEVIEEEGLLEHALELEGVFRKKMADWTTKYKIVGDTRVKGCLMGVELVKDKKTKEPSTRRADGLSRGVPIGLADSRGHILRESADHHAQRMAEKAMDIIEEAIAHTEKKLGDA